MSVKGLAHVAIRALWMKYIKKPLPTEQEPLSNPISLHLANLL